MFHKELAVKKLLIIIAFLVFARTSYAESDENSLFQITGDAKIKQFLINKEPDQIKLDYRGNNDNADQELGLSVRARICNHFYIDAYPYFWHSMENQISRIGLKGEVKASPWFLGQLDDRLRIGYGHHSWHNADAKFRGVGGKSQDWLFFELDVLKHKYTYDGKTDFEINFQVKPKLFLNNRDPSAIKKLYNRNEYHAIAALEIPIDMAFCDDWAELHLKPYWMLSRGSDRYGIWGEFDFKIYKGIWVYADGQYYRAGSSSREQLGIGVMLRFK